MCNMTTIELKYSLFKDIDSISDESMLYKVTALVRSMLIVSRPKMVDMEVQKDIPDFVRNMSVNTGLSGDVDAKELMHAHMIERYG